MAHLMVADAVLDMLQVLDLWEEQLVVAGVD